MNKYTERLYNGIIKENPTLILMLGMCPTLAVSVRAMNGIGMGLAVTFVLICSNVIISMLKKIIPNTVRIPAYILIIATYILIIATFVTIVKLVLDKFIPSLYDALGVYLPLIVVNCIILGRAESFASKNPVLDSAFDGLFMGIGFTLSITLMGAFREILGAGAIFGIQLWDANVFSIAFFSSSAGAFFTYALFIAVFNYLIAKSKNKASAKGGL